MAKWDEKCVYEQDLASLGNFVYRCWRTKVSMAEEAEKRARGLPEWIGEEHEWEEYAGGGEQTAKCGKTEYEVRAWRGGGRERE